LKDVGAWQGTFEPSVRYVFHGAKACLKTKYRSPDTTVFSKPNDIASRVSHQYEKPHACMRLK